MRYYLIAGEASGDLHGSNLMRGIKKFDTEAVFRFFGGDLMAQVENGLVSHYREGAFMGLDVLLHLPTILKKIKFCEQDILQYKPDVLILIDYPGFNMKIAKFAHEHGIKVYYYIAPKAWAWRKKRVWDLKKYVDKLFVIFPFEVYFFRQFGINVEYYGNPLKDALHDFSINKKLTESELIQKYQLEDKPIIALVPGSRQGEIKRILPEMLKATQYIQGEYQYVITGAPSIEPAFYQNIIKNYRVRIIYNDTYNIITNARAAIVTSGTATLETALLGTPQVVVFKTGWFTYFIGRPFVRIRFFSLVNIIAEKQVVKELLQFNLAGQIADEMKNLLTHDSYVNQMHQEYCLISEKLGNFGVSERIARRIVYSLK